MSTISLTRLGALAAALFLGAVAAATAQPDPTAGGLAQLIRPLMAPASPYPSSAAWSDLDKVRAIRWGAGPVMLNRPSPDGNYFARPGQAILAGRQVLVVATGARSMVFSLYLRDPAPPASAEALVAGLQRAGYSVAPARCPLDRARPGPRRWYRLSLPQKNPVFLYAGPLASGGGGYTLFLGELPPMTRAEATLYTDDCSGAARPGPGKGPGRAANGEEAVVSVIEALLRPLGAASTLPWPALASLPSTNWPSLTPARMTNPWTDAGEDRNPRLLQGQFKTSATRMAAIATGEERGANRFYLREGGNLPRGAVLAGLARDGFTLTPLRCGKVYTETSQAWFRIAGAGKAPAVLYRAQHKTDGVWTEDYGLWLDNVLPPLEPGQSAPVAGRCPGWG